MEGRARRICIVGCSGAGKSVLATEISNLVGLPLVSLDRFYWRAGWQPTPEDEWRALHDRLIAAGEWVMEGTYYSTVDRRLAVADMVVFMDYPRYRCIFRVVKRTLRWWRCERPGSPQGCRERFDLSFFRYVWRFRQDYRPRLLELLRQHKAVEVVLIRNDHERTEFVARFARSV